MIMREQLEQVFGNLLKEYKVTKISLPLYLQDGRQIISVNIAGHVFYIVRFMMSDRFNISTLKKQLIKYRETMDVPVVYGFSKITTYQRKSMVENGISFIAENGQIYLPFIGAYFEKCFSTENQVKEQFTPASQMLFLLFLYRNNSYSKSEAAKALKISSMSITRASNQLSEVGLITEEKYGTEVRMNICCEDRDEFYERGKKYLINPVQSYIYLPNARKRKMVPEAGEFALCRWSDLGNAEYVEYAISKDNPIVAKWLSVDPRLYDYKNICRFQLWKYDPLLFSNRDTVDPVSLICSLRDSNDERIQMCLDEVKEEISGWIIQET